MSEKLIIRNWAEIIWTMYDTTPKLYASDTFYLIDKFRRDLHVMPKAKSSINSGSNQNNVRWANANLSAENSQEILEIVDSKTDPMEYLLRQVANGCSFSVKWRVDKSDYLAYLFEPDVDNNKQSYGLSAYATDLRTALIVLCFKHDVLLSGYAGNGATETTTFG